MDFSHLWHAILHTKIGATLASLAGVLCMAIIWKPIAFSKFKASELLMALSFYGITAGFFLTGGIANYIGSDKQPDDLLTIGFIVGVTSVGVINLLAALFKKMEHEDKHLIDIVNVIRGKESDE